MTGSACHHTNEGQRGMNRSEVELECETDGRILHAAEPCDGTNPMTGRPCGMGYHQGYHRDAVGAEWLDEE